MTVAPHRGAKIGPRIAMLVSQAIVATHQKLLHTKHKLAMAVFNTISDEISVEVDQTMKPVYAGLAEAYGEDGPAYELLKFMRDNSGQLKAIAGSAVGVSGLLWAISQIMNNELAPAVYAAVGTNPHLLPDNGTIATLAAQGYTSNDNAISAMGSNGLPAGWANDLVQAALAWPGVADALDFLRRGLIDEAEFNGILVRNGVPNNLIGDYLAQQYVKPTPADAALAYLRSNIDLETAQSYAQEWGTDADSLNVLIGNTGEPPGAEQLMEAYRRGFITEDQFNTGILQSRIRNEWIPTLLALRYTPMSVADAVNAVVQDQMSFDDGSAIADQNGLEPGQFQTLYNTAGEPLSRGEMLELFNRGEVSTAEVEQAIRESRVKNKYVDTVMQLAVRLPEPRMLSTAVEYGTISQADAIKYAMDYGYTQEVATGLISSAIQAKLQTYTNRVMASIEALYENNAIDETTAKAYMGSLNYTEQESDYIIESINFRQQEKIVVSAIAGVRSKYIGHHIDQPTASAYLDQLGVPSGQRDQLLSEWAIDLEANIKLLTETQIVKAFTMQLMNETDATCYLELLGYSSSDAALLLQGV